MSCSLDAMVPAASHHRGDYAHGMSDTATYGIFTLGMVLVPGERIPLHLFEPRYRQLFADCVLENTPFVLRFADESGPAPIGCTARFDEVLDRFEDGRISVVIVGVNAVEIGDAVDGRLYDCAQCTTLIDAPSPSDPALAARATQRFEELAAAVTGTAQSPAHDDEIPWSYVLAAHIELAPDIKQELLTTRDESARLELMIVALDAEIAHVRRAELAAERAPTNGKVPHD